MKNKESKLVDLEKPNKNSYLELEETIIPFPDSFNIQKNNEINYILRLAHPFEYEKVILKSRITLFDNEDYHTLDNRFSDLVNWYHSTVYNYNNDILDKNNFLIHNTEIAASSFIFDQFHKNEKMIQKNLFFNDIILIRNNKYYRYILSKNKFLYKGTCLTDEIKKAIISRDKLTEQAIEYLLILSHPKRGSIIYGERAYQNSLLYAGELNQIIISIANLRPKEIRMRKYIDAFDFLLLSKVGIEDNNSVVTAIFEVHNFKSSS